MTVRNVGIGRRPRASRRAALITFALCVGVSGCEICNDDSSDPGSTPTQKAATDSFLGADDFAGDYIAKSGETTMGGSAIYEGRIVVSNQLRSQVEAVLPSDLQLAANTSTTPDVHPVMLIFGHQTKTGWVLPGGFEPPVGDDYSELILMIPFVQRLGRQKLHNYMVRIYLNDHWALVVGNWWYGLQKIDAGFAETPNSFEVFDGLGAQLFGLTITSSGNWIASDDAQMNLANYQDLLTIIDMPVLGTLSWTPADQHVCTYFDWQVAAAEVRPIATRHKYAKAFAAGLDNWVGTEFSSVLDGAFEVRGLKWMLRMPPAGCSY